MLKSWFAGLGEVCFCLILSSKQMLHREQICNIGRLIVNFAAF